MFIPNRIFQSDSCGSGSKISTCWISFHQLRSIRFFRLWFPCRSPSIYSSGKSAFFGFGRDEFFGFSVLGGGIAESFPGGKAEVPEGPGCPLFAVSESEAEVPEGPGCPSFAVSEGEGAGSSMIVN